MGMVSIPIVPKMASLQCPSKEVRDEVDFLHADKTSKLLASCFQHFEHHIFLQGNTVIIDGYDQAFSKYSK